MAKPSSNIKENKQGERETKKKEERKRNFFEEKSKQRREKKILVQFVLDQILTIFQWDILLAILCPTSIRF